MYWCPTSESEREPSRRLLPLSWHPSHEYHPPILDDSPRNEKDKRIKKNLAVPAPRWLWWLGTCLAILMFSTIGTTISVWRITRQEDDSRASRMHSMHSASSERAKARVVHLVLPGKSHKKTRFVVPDDVTWEEFMLGIQERLQLPVVSEMMIHTTLGEEIMSIDDLVDGDNLIIHVDTRR
mmetsp:Transcript_28401/g.62191  ORF Transcript_28401/g.62191 Transcript_28401/m.62191 type:complete len:181 (+) Transcript_28401:932-1474(+)|eukprot:6182348-Pleurochrysis_carterae.AAC.6